MNKEMIKTDLEFLKQRAIDEEFIEGQVDKLQAIGVQNIINEYGTDDIDKIDELWWCVLGKMIDVYMSTDNREYI